MSASTPGHVAATLAALLITALASNQMIAPTFWTDPKSNNDYFLTVQYPESQVKGFDDLQVAADADSFRVQIKHLLAKADVEARQGPLGFAVVART